MQRKLIAFTLVALGAVGLGGLIAQQGQDQDEDAMMDVMMKAGTPGEHHAYLNVFEGSWDVAAKIWMAAGAPPSEEKATATYRWIMSGRYLEEKFEGRFAGMPFNGINILGYDNVMKRYQSIWFDSMSTGMAVAVGQADEGGKRIVFEGSTPNPMAGGMTPYRVVTEIESNDRFVFAYFEPGRDGKEFKSMEMVYTRSTKAAGGASSIR